MYNVQYLTNILLNNSRYQVAILTDSVENIKKKERFFSFFKPYISQEIHHLFFK